MILYAAIFRMEGALILVEKASEEMSDTLEALGSDSSFIVEHFQRYCQEEEIPDGEQRWNCAADSLRMQRHCKDKLLYCCVADDRES